MRNKMLAVLATIAVALVLGASTARADQISLGDSCAGTLSVGAGPTVGGTVTGCHGTWEQGATDTSITPWSLTGGTAFDVTDSGTNVLSGSVDWASFVGNTLGGWLTVSSVTGFNNEFAVDGVYWIDITFQPGTCNPDGETLYGCAVSSGEVLTNPVPEPGTLTLLGTGLLTMAGFLRRKLSA